MRKKNKKKNKMKYFYRIFCGLIFLILLFLMVSDINDLNSEGERYGWSLPLTGALVFGGLIVGGYMAGRESLADKSNKSLD